ncbi:MAG: ABC transporter substrate-binding protein [Treponema sp.]|jgi:putative ABC transport system substrate-binding protein|nr:ABC transporter substrate-binding protein [Treponema sp.]
MKSFGIALVCALAALGCARETEKDPAGAAEEAAAGRIKIGIAKLVQHEALDACEQGIQDALIIRGFNGVSVDLQNAGGDVNTAAQIAGKFKNDGVDVAVGIATTMAVALAEVLRDTPVVFSAVTDPVGARLVSSLDGGEGNVTGLSDAIPTAEHLRLFQEIAGIKTLGYIYTGSEDNSISSLALVEEACRDYGITLVSQAINGSAELRAAAQDLVSRVDGVYLTTDNTVFAALPALVEVFREAKKPVFSADVTGAMNGGCLAASGFNYYKAGIATGNIVADILEGKRPGDIPVKFLTDPAETDLLFDLDEAANCGIVIPERYLDEANYLIKDGELIQMR